MQKRHKVIIITSPSVRVRLASLSDPSLRSKLSRIVSPNFRRAIDVPDGDNHVGTFGDELVADLSVVEGLTHSERDGWVEPEGFVHDAVEVGKLFERVGELFCGHGLHVFGKGMLDFFVEFLLNLGVLGQQVT